ncbi:general stress protein [Neosynechococcus sphagnicola]|uniref:general stress protein n=1 Tax=Neosynechococcus sphagnicola TaxID=1501145 RepID=UPI000907A36A|nr:general stress protein [Neosynechococcus sphagnicola]
MSLPTDHQTPHSPTPDSYDPHIIPAETAARKDREGDSYKHIPENSESSDSIDTTGGYTVDKEGLTNNYATEPEMYAESPGDLQKQGNSTSTTNKYSIVDIFPSHTEAESVVSEMQKAGLDPQKISVLGKDRQSTDQVHGAFNWKDISQAEGLVAVLVELGISSTEALKYETEINAGKFVVLVMGSDEDISQANQIFHNIGHRTLEESTT